MLPRVRLRSSAVIALCCGLLCSLAGCNRAETPSPPAPAAPTAKAPPPPSTPLVSATPQEPELQPDWRALLTQLGDPSLVTLEQTDAGCQWSVLRPPQLDARLFLVTHTCPFGKSLVWDRRGGRTFFAVEGTLYLHDWQAAKVDKVGPVPISRADPELGISSRGVLRLCDYQERPVKLDEEVGFRVTMELQSNGSWDSVGEERTDQEQPLEPCSGPHDRERSGGVFYEPDPQPVATCALDQAPALSAGCPNRAALGVLSSETSDSAHDGFEYLAIGDDDFLAYPTSVFRNLASATPPIFSVVDNFVRRLYDRVLPNSQLVDILFAGDYFIVRAEDDLTNARLFKKREREPLEVFPDEMRVIWIPGTIPPAEVITVSARRD